MIPKTPRTLADFAQLREAEEYFEFLDVACDPAILAANRLSLLRRFGLELAGVARREDDPEERVLERYAHALARAHASFEGRPASEQKLFALGRPALVRLGRSG